MYTLLLIFTAMPIQAVPSTSTNKQTNKQTPWPLVRERTIPTERPPLVDEIQLLWIEGCRVVSAADPLRSLLLLFPGNVRRKCSLNLGHFWGPACGEVEHARHLMSPRILKIYYERKYQIYTLIHPHLDAFIDNFRYRGDIDVK
jgi:hypothetical protein